MHRRRRVWTCTTPSNASSSCTASRTLSVIAIGQAGENQVRFGAWINELDRASGHIFVIEGDPASVTVIDPRTDAPIATIKVGEKLVYPNHGVTIVEQIGESAIIGAGDTYYHLRLLANNSRLMVPISCASIG